MSLMTFMSTHNIAYVVLVIIRISMALFPLVNRGYVHPDEFFQAGEVMAGDVLTLDVDPPWEFQATKPCRSVIGPALLTGFPFSIIALLRFFLGNIILNTTFLLIAQRCIICTLSFLVDWSVYRLCSRLHVNAKLRLLCLASSWVILVFGTRPFSNTVELVLFSLLAEILLREPNHQWEHSREYAGALFAIGCFNRFTFPVFVMPLWLYGLAINSVVPGGSLPPLTDIELMAMASSDASTPKENISSTTKLNVVENVSGNSKYIPPISRPSHQIRSSTVSINRPGAVSGIMYGLELRSRREEVATNNDVVRECSKNVKEVVTLTRLKNWTWRCGFLWNSTSFLCRALCGAVASTTVCVIIDSYYFTSSDISSGLKVVGDIVAGDVLSSLTLLWSSLIKNITVTPLNGLLYNLDVENLGLHGLHPRITHVVVNMPMLFGPLSIIAIFAFCSLVGQPRRRFHLIHYWFGVDKEEDSIRSGSSRHVDWEFSSGKAVIKEDPESMMIYRHWMWITLVGCTVSGTFFLSLMPHQEPRFLIPLLTPIIILFGGWIFGNNSKGWLRTTWLVLNLFGFLFWGVAHQGGILPCLSYLQNDIQTIDVMLLDSGVDIKASTHIIFAHTYMPPHHLLARPLNASHSVTLHDIHGAALDQLDVLLLGNITTEIAAERHRGYLKAQVYVVLPGNLDITELGARSRLLLRERFSPHIHLDGQWTWNEHPWSLLLYEFVPPLPR